MRRKLHFAMFVFTVVILTVALGKANSVAEAANCPGLETDCSGGGPAVSAPTPTAGGGNGNNGNNNSNSIGNPPACPSPQVRPGAITVSALKLAPAYPLVIGQDDTRRGADARWEITIEPTVYVSWRTIPEYERECGSTGGRPANCTQPNGMPGRFHDVQVGWRCEASTTYYPEGVNFANLEAHLSQASRDWILSGELQIRYPGAYLHNPDMTFRGGNAWVSGNVFHFVYEQANIPFADPGTWNLTISGQTSGTPVSPPRNFGGTGGTLPVYLRETTIIQ